MRAEARLHLVSGSVFKTDGARPTPRPAGSIPVRFRSTGRTRLALSEGTFSRAIRVPLTLR
jgi:hypothetical protein